MELVMVMWVVGLVQVLGQNLGTFKDAIVVEVQVGSQEINNTVCLCL
jgi:hypothetical protein